MLLPQNKTLLKIYIHMYVIIIIIIVIFINRVVRSGQASVDKPSECYISHSGECKVSYKYAFSSIFVITTIRNAFK